MLSKRVHVMLGRVEVNLVEAWARKQIRFVEAITKHSFQTEVEQAYHDLIELATGKGFSRWDFEDLNSLEKFNALITQNIAVKFAEEVSKEIFLEKSHEEVEEETISSADWITSQIIHTQKIIREKIANKAIEKVQMEYRRTHLREKDYGYDEYCD